MSDGSDSGSVGAARETNCDDADTVVDVALSGSRCVMILHDVSHVFRVNM